MKKHIIAIMLFCTLILISACSAGNKGAVQQSPAPTVVPRSEATASPAEGSVVFGVKNNIGGDIYEMRVSPNSLDEFGDDILGDKILAQGESRTVSFLPQDTYSYWDIRVLTENGNTYTWQNVEFGNFSEIELRMGDNGPEFSVK